MQSQYHSIIVYSLYDFYDSINFEDELFTALHMEEPIEVPVPALFKKQAVPFRVSRYKSLIFWWFRLGGGGSAGGRGWQDLSNDYIPFPKLYIIPIVNIEEWVSPELFSPSWIDNQKTLLYRTISGLYSFEPYLSSKLDMVIVKIIQQKEKAFSLDLETEGWLEKLYQETHLQEADNPNSEASNRRLALEQRIRIIDIELDTLPEKLLELVGHPSTNDNPSHTHITLPTLPDISISLENIGVLSPTSLRFTEEMVQQLSQQKRAFTLWVDAAPIPTLTGYLSNAQIREQIELEEHWVTYADRVLAFPTFEPDPCLCSQKYYSNAKLAAAYYAYIEYEGQVFDSFKALEYSIPVQAYQATIKGTRRYKYEAHPRQSIETIIEKMYAFVEKIKYG